jgi:hypothetical protein
MAAEVSNEVASFRSNGPFAVPHKVPHHQVQIFRVQCLVVRFACARRLTRDQERVDEDIGRRSCVEGVAVSEGPEALNV